ncbi:lipocalin family protein [uncultured Chitinophaga sp.]|uniref:lipocalin family protein n=1 Tax=uncultured Chitinophaga sp. TaxID=339340 RepID=UPI0025F814CE|nr:lipocalin family protein [uncultured Chitinophaga sp.]
MNKLKLALPLALAAVLFSCDKDDDKPKTIKEKIIGKWGFQSITSSKPITWEVGGEPTTDGFTHLATCVKDDYLVFKADNVLEENEGATKCDPQATQSTNTEWSIDGSNIEISGETFKFISVDGSTLKVSDVVDTEEQGEVTLTLVLKRK